MGQPLLLDPVPIKTEYNIETYGDFFAEPSFVDCEDDDSFLEYAYVDDKGNIVSWYPAKKEIINGLRWTSESREITEKTEKYDDNIEEPHAHLYFCEYDLSVYPIYSEDTVLKKDGIKYHKLPEVRFLSPEKCDILLNSGLTRVIDNYDLVNTMIEMADENVDVFVFLEPIYVDDTSVVCSFKYSKTNQVSCYDEKNSLIMSGATLITNADKKIIEQQYPAVVFKILDTASLQTAYPSFMLTK